MAFRAKYFLEIKRRKVVFLWEKKRQLWLAMALNQTLPLNVRSIFLNKLRASRNMSAVKLKNRCIVSNRSKSVIRFFQLSRIVFRNYAREGLLVGLKRSSW